MDLHALLGVTKSASQSEIKAAFRKKALQLHPDRCRQTSSPHKPACRPCTTLGSSKQLPAYRQAEATPGQAARIAKEFEAVKEAYDTLTDGKHCPAP